MRLKTKKKFISGSEKEEWYLTAREIEYLSLVALGFKNHMIADKLFVTKSTVKKMLENIYKKLFAKDRANAIAIAFLHDLINVKVLTDIRVKYSIKR